MALPVGPVSSSLILEAEFVKALFAGILARVAR